MGIGTGVVKVWIGLLGVQSVTTMGKNKINTSKTRDPRGLTNKVAKIVAGFSPLLRVKAPPFCQ